MKAKEKKIKKWRARYRIDEEAVKTANPFGLRFSANLPDSADVVAEFREGVSPDVIEAHARFAKPAGYVFVAVEEVKDF